MNNQEERACNLITNILEVAHIKVIPANSEKLVDMYGSTYKLEELQNYIDLDYMDYIYNYLLLSWVFKSDAPDIFTLNSDFDIMLKNPFENREFDCKFSWYNLSVQPYDLILTKPNEQYISIAKKFFFRMQSRYETILKELISNNISMSIINIYTDSYYELRDCFVRR